MSRPEALADSATIRKILKEDGPTTKTSLSSLESGIARVLGVNCRRLSVTVVTLFSAPDSDVDAEVLSFLNAVGQESQSGPPSISVDFASLFEEEGIPSVAAMGTLVRTSEDSPSYWVKVELVQAEQGSKGPPEDQFLPLYELLGRVQDSFGDLTLQCSADFTHELGDGVSSRINLPFPLMLSERESGRSATHIESVTLSRRTSNGLSYTVEVDEHEMIEDEEQSPTRKVVTHHVSFVARGPLSDDFLTRLRGVAEEISENLLSREQEDTL